MFRLVEPVNFELFGSLFFMEDLEERAIVAILVIVVLATLWWFGTTNKEVAKHEEVKREYEAMEKRMKSIEREYSILTGTDIRQTFTGTGVHRAFDELLTKRSS